jgi:AcrR family transcriptional regulator
METHLKTGRCSPTREATVSRRRTEILDKAIELFAARCYAGTDTQLLADELHLGKGTLYRYFENKEELFLAAVDHILGKMRERIDAATAAATDPLAVMRAGILAYLSFFAEHPDYVELLVQERALFKDREKPIYFQYRERNVQRWREIYRKLMADGRVRTMPPERISDVVSDLMYGTMCANYFAHRNPDPVQQVEAILDVVWNGILSDEERNRHAAAREELAQSAP